MTQTCLSHMFVVYRWSSHDTGSSRDVVMACDAEGNVVMHTTNRLSANPPSTLGGEAYGQRQ